jgi:hypothetical protein
VRASVAEGGEAEEGGAGGEGGVEAGAGGGAEESGEAEEGGEGGESDEGGEGASEWGVWRSCTSSRSSWRARAAWTRSSSRPRGRRRPSRGSRWRCPRARSPPSHTPPEEEGRRSPEAGRQVAGGGHGAEAGAQAWTPPSAAGGERHQWGGPPVSLGTVSPAKWWWGCWGPPRAALRPGGATSV